MIELQIKKKINQLQRSKSIKEIEKFNFKEFKVNLLKYIKSLQINQSHFLYKYSISRDKPTLYASVFVLMTLSLLYEVDKLSDQEKEDWQKYFDSFQSEIDGLYYDPVLENNIFYDSDWWGARHLALLIVTASTQIGYRPKFPFLFLKEYYKLESIDRLLNQVDWENPTSHSNDIDNKIMNIGCLLQYQRDFRDDKYAADSVEYLKKQLKIKINSKTGIWGSWDVENSQQLSRMVQFAYHILVIFFYDSDYDFDSEKIVKLVLKTKNEYNGFGVNLNSSACEDIDSIDILIRLSKYCTLTTQSKIQEQIRKSFQWVLLNQQEDGGFVFRINQEFTYGSIETSSKKNESAIFPTWFRTLSIAYMSNYLIKPNNFKIIHCPGSEYK